MESTIKLTKITSKDYKKSSKKTLIYGTTPTKFGYCLAAFRNNALCYLGFYDEEKDKNSKIEDMKKWWKDSPLEEDDALIAKKIPELFQDDTKYEICVKGTDFEMKVWEALLNVKKGFTVSYEDVAIAIGNKKAIRAAASAVAKNRIAYFIPCHRIIKKNGAIHKYGGGVDRKVKMLKSEGAI